MRCHWLYGFLIAYLSIWAHEALHDVVNLAHVLVFWLAVHPGYWWSRASKQTSKCIYCGRGTRRVVEGPPSQPLSPKPPVTGGYRCHIPYTRESVRVSEALE